jgi:hypothetical protein
LWRARDFYPKVGGMPELVCDSARMASSSTLPIDGALIDRVLRLDDDEELRYGMALNARESIRRSFTVEMMADKVIHTVLSAIGEEFNAVRILVDGRWMSAPMRGMGRFARLNWYSRSWERTSSLSSCPKGSVHSYASSALVP